MVEVRQCTNKGNNEAMKRGTEKDSNAPKTDIAPKEKRHLLTFSATWKWLHRFRSHAACICQLLQAAPRVAITVPHGTWAHVIDAPQIPSRAIAPAYALHPAGWSDTGCMYYSMSVDISGQLG